MKQIDEVKLATVLAQYKADSALLVSNMITSVSALLTDIPIAPTPLPIIPPALTIDYTKTIRFGLATHAYKMGLSKPGFVQSFPDQKGGPSLDYIGSASPTLGLPYVTKDGLLFLQNQANISYTANIKGDGNHADINNAVYPREVWMVLYKPDYFVYEKFTDRDFYMGDFGSSTPIDAYAGGVRFTNDTNIPRFVNTTIPVNQFSIWRVRLTATPKNDAVNVELWVNGVKQSSTGQVQTWFRKFYCIGLGTDTNNEYVGFAEVFATPVLTDTQALQITTELQAEYKPLNLPYATGITYTVSGTNLTASCSGISAGGTAKIKWVNMPSGPESSVYMSQYDGKWTIPIPGNCRAEITVYDAQGAYFDIPSTKYFQK